MAWAPAESLDSKWVEAGAKMNLVSANPEPEDQMKAAVLDALGDAKAKQMGDAAAWADSAYKAEPASWTADTPKFTPAASSWIDEEPKLQLAAADWGDNGTETADIAFGDWKADDGGDAKTDVIDGEEVMDDSAVDEEVVDEGAVDSELETPLTPVENGVGGPDEAVAGDLTPQPAAHNYPPCDPGPGDDNCIQLYEPGVRAALASWNAPTGGLMDNSATTAMGGPYEPVDTGMEMADATIASEHHPIADEGMGGPISETGYPPCSGSPDDDRCIQLYEPGVTGEGN
jgi:hypothetical protein